MKAFGFVTRAVVLEAVAVGAVIWLAGGRLPARDAESSEETPVMAVAQSDFDEQNRSDFVQSKLERVAAKFRSGASQLVDETMATWFKK